MANLALVTLIVHDYDTAIDLFVGVTTWIVAASFTSLVALQGPPPRVQMPRPGQTATSRATQPASAVTVMTWVTRFGNDGVHALELVVLWRGTPGWLMATPRSSSGGVSAGELQETARYGGVTLNLRFSADKRTADINGRRVELGEANVILVDHVDGPGGPQVLRTLRIDPALPPSDDGRARLDGILGRSQDIVSFLKCEIPMPGGKGQASIDKLCAQLLGR